MVDRVSEVWTPSLRDLWSRIEAHDLGPNVPLSFAARLAREKSWRKPFASGAIAEYRRFCFLAVASSSPVTPSPVVDEVWHLHLTYTRDYWQVWCRSVLGETLHHDPTSGGLAERYRHARQYAETLALYERFFSAPAPLYWPATSELVGDRPRWRQIVATVFSTPFLRRGTRARC